MDSPVWKSSYQPQKVLAITSLMMANHSGARLSIDGKMVELEPGQFWTSLKSLENVTRLSTQEIRTSIKNLENLGFLTSSSTSKGRLINIINWDTYQHEELIANKLSNKRLTNAQQTPNKRLTTNKNDKNERMVRKDKDTEVLTSASVQSNKLFDQFWNPYPNKVNKKEARKCWATRIRHGTDPQQMILASNNYSKHCLNNQTEKRFIMHPSTFIGPNEKWENYIETGKKQKLTGKSAKTVEALNDFIKDEEK